MRGEDVQQHAMYSYLSPEERVPANHPLRAIRQITDHILKEMSRLFTRMYARLGRPSIPPEKLLRALVLHQEPRAAAGGRRGAQVLPAGSEGSPGLVFDVG